MKTKLFSLVMLSLLSVNSYAALKCDIKVETKKSQKSKLFLNQIEIISLSSYESCDAGPLEKAAIASVPIVGMFWEKNVGSKCEVIVEGKTFTKKNPNLVKQKNVTKSFSLQSMETVTNLTLYST